MKLALISQKGILNMIDSLVRLTSYSSEATLVIFIVIIFIVAMNQSKFKVRPSPF